jgi:hypothetical protein
MTTAEASKPTPPNAHCFLWSLTSAGAVLAVLAVVRIAAPGLEGEHLAGRLLFSAVLATLASGLLARRSRGPWPWWQYPLVVAPVEVLLVVAEGVAGTS